MTEQTEKKYVVPLCPSCGQPLETVQYNDYSTYNFNEETGTYQLDPMSGDADTKCPNCEHNVGRDLITEGPCNFQMKSTDDYIYCEDCKEFVDFWKYGDIESTGHAKHKWRHVTPEELQNCVKDCVEDGCFEEV
jgi:hypothetical protein